ncbi:AraC family transcriptional regulator N-terminal domain-containing protein [Gallaecimonas kandeliae]|uniref:AraC family transcriptional regulator n=1 Tax=Gallaecimonas kandeliae TaxID=3029055 RepID=UPI0026485FFC|nr:helix-turn-helix domain-containing protein [Gallaecimonas kandeliae]WKE65164.1 AraC family transcriptional regulator N-terminal domain-containing protein [Gallaecimonas kandeliae]
MQMLERLSSKARRREAVENRVSFQGSQVELAIYDTYEPAQKVALRSENLLYCAMLTGSKRMHGIGGTPRVFLPHESFVLAPEQPVWIDFPDAKPQTPTTCIAIDISLDRIQAVARRLEQQPRDPALGPPQYQHRAVHCRHNRETQQLLERIIGTFLEPAPEQAMLIDLQLSELVMRLLRQQSRDLLLEALAQGQIHHGLLAAMAHLKASPGQPLDMERLSREACISKAQLYRLFRQELGLTPGEYQQQLRLDQARQWLSEGLMSVTEVAFELGYQSLSHFSRRFKAATGLSPGRYRQQQPAAH